MFGTRLLRKVGRDIGFRTARGVRVRILSEPGRWMADADRTELLEGMRELSARGTGGKGLQYGILAGDPTLWRHAILTLLSDPTGRLVGFGAMVLLPLRVGGRRRDVLHLGLVMLDPSWRGRGLTLLLYALSLVLVLVRRGFRSLWVSNVSQVPAVLGMVETTLEDVYPGPGRRGSPSAVHLALAHQIMACHRNAFGVGDEAEFDARRFVITNAYTGGSDNLKKSLAEAAGHRDAAFAEWCSRELDYDRGDDFLQLGRFTLRVAAGCLASFLSRSARRAAVAARGRPLLAQTARARRGDLSGIGAGEILS